MTRMHCQGKNLEPPDEDQTKKHNTATEFGLEEPVGVQDILCRTGRVLKNPSGRYTLVSHSLCRKTTHYFSFVILFLSVNVVDKVNPLKSTDFGCRVLLLPRIVECLLTKL